MSSMSDISFDDTQPIPSQTITDAMGLNDSVYRLIECACTTPGLPKFVLAIYGVDLQLCILASNLHPRSPASRIDQLDFVLRNTPPLRDKKLLNIPMVVVDVCLCFSVPERQVNLRQSISAFQASATPKPNSNPTHVGINIAQQVAWHVPGHLDKSSLLWGRIEMSVRSL